MGKWGFDMKYNNETGQTIERPSRLEKDENMTGFTDANDGLHAEHKDHPEDYEDIILLEDIADEYLMEDEDVADLDFRMTADGEDGEEPIRLEASNIITAPEYLEEPILLQDIADEYLMEDEDVADLDSKLIPDAEEDEEEDIIPLGIEDIFSADASDEPILFDEAHSEFEEDEDVIDLGLEDIIAASDSDPPILLDDIAEELPQAYQEPADSDVEEPIVLQDQVSPESAVDEDGETIMAPPDFEEPIVLQDEVSPVGSFDEDGETIMAPPDIEETIFLGNEVSEIPAGGGFDEDGETIMAPPDIEETIFLGNEVSEIPAGGGFDEDGETIMAPPDIEETIFLGDEVSEIPAGSGFDDEDGETIMAPPTSNFEDPIMLQNEVSESDDDEIIDLEDEAIILLEEVEETRDDSEDADKTSLPEDEADPFDLIDSAALLEPEHMGNAQENEAVGDLIHDDFPESAEDKEQKLHPPGIEELFDLASKASREIEAAAPETRDAEYPPDLEDISDFSLPADAEPKPSEKTEDDFSTDADGKRAEKTGKADEEGKRTEKTDEDFSSDAETFLYDGGTSFLQDDEQQVITPQDADAEDTPLLDIEEIFDLSGKKSAPREESPEDIDNSPPIDIEKIFEISDKVYPPSEESEKFIKAIGEQLEELETEERPDLPDKKSLDEISEPPDLEPGEIQDREKDLLDLLEFDSETAIPDNLLDSAPDRLTPEEPEDNIFSEDDILSQGDVREEGERGEISDWEGESEYLEEELPLPPEQLESLLEQVIKKVFSEKMFSDKIEIKLVEVIEKAVAREMDRLKDVLFVEEVADE
jgi:hypothetical protein